MQKKRTVEEEILWQLKIQNGTHIFTPRVLRTLLWIVVALVAWGVIGVLFVGITGIGR